MAQKPSPKQTTKKYAANLLGRFVGAKLRKIQASIQCQSRPLTGPPHASFGLSAAYPRTATTPLKTLIKSTKLWHGTGRFQYRDGQIVDIFQFVINHGKLRPQLDTWDFVGPMTTLSLTTSRMYARAYADMHGKGSQEPGRYGSALFWAALFVGDMKFEGIIEGRGWTRQGWRTIQKHVIKNTDLWYRKINSKKLSTMEAFQCGSDIPGNYPIIFGIKAQISNQPPPPAPLHCMKSALSIPYP